MRVAVIGAGSWGTALAILLARKGASVGLFGRNTADLASIRDLRENRHYLPGFSIPEGVEAVSGKEELGDVDLWVVAVPSTGIRWAASLLPEQPSKVVLASKGLEGAGRLLGDVLFEVRPSAKLAALSGPNLAIEIVRGIPTAAVSASEDDEVAEYVRDAFIGPSYRVYVSNDRVGVELAGALKNVLAIAAGISDGLGFGDNTKGALLARGLHEMTSLGLAMGSRVETFMGIAGVGDLFATAASTLSRNYRVGRAIGEGAPLLEALDRVGQVAEGVGTADAAGKLAIRHDIPMPVFEATRAVIHGQVGAAEAVAQLMERLPKREGFLRCP